jgi:hypothetical protein
MSEVEDSDMSEVYWRMVHRPKAGAAGSPGGGMASLAVLRTVAPPPCGRCANPLYQCEELQTSQKW